MTDASPKLRPSARALDSVLSGDGLRTLFQPIFEIKTRKLIGYEALVRGPEGSNLESPAALFSAAEREGRLAELDALCQTTAIDNAISAGLSPPFFLFLNGELSTVDALDSAERQAPAFRLALKRGLPIVFEQTERGVIEDPAALISSVDRARRAGWGIALDDVGADPRALSLLPVVDPDVIKLDMNLLQRGADDYAAEVANAIAAEGERTGPLVIAEGVESGLQLERAQALGATHVQGFLFGPPAELTPVAETANGRPPRHLGTPIPQDDPFAVFEETVPTQIAPESLVYALSRRIEEQAGALGTSGLLIASFQFADRFDGAVKERYCELSERLGFVGAVGTGMPDAPGGMIRGGDLEGDVILEKQWCVALLSPQTAGGFCARELDSEGRGGERRFELAISQDRALIARAARSMLRYIGATEAPERAE